MDGQAKVPNGVKDIVSKISIFHIYIYIGVIILFNQAKQRNALFPVFRTVGFSLSSADFISCLFFKKNKRKSRRRSQKKNVDTFAEGRVMGGEGRSPWKGRPRPGLRWSNGVEFGGGWARSFLACPKEGLFDFACFGLESDH